MFERYILASDFKRIDARYSMAKLPEKVEYTPSYNIGFGDKCAIINNNQTKEIQSYDFGLNVDSHVLHFVRGEGDRNTDDTPFHTGSKAIFLKSGYNRLIRFKLCVVLADAFVVSKGK